MTWAILAVIWAVAAVLWSARLAVNIVDGERWLAEATIVFIATMQAISAVIRAVSQ